MKRPLPPKSVVKLVKLWPHARKHGYEVGQTWRIGYYRRRDGLDVIWLVDASGEYSQTADHDWIDKHFEIIHISDEKSLFGGSRPVIGAIPLETAS